MSVFLIKHHLLNVELNLRLFSIKILGNMSQGNIIQVQVFIFS